MTERFIPPHGGYRNLRSYQKAEIVYDATVYFCNRFLNRRDRTHDQMACAPKPRRRRIQAARSGKQNIAEASQVSGTSKELEIKLTNVTNYLLDQQLRRREKDFVEKGGLRESMTRARLAERAKQNRHR